MEELGIGRPSTYAVTLKVLQVMDMTCISHCGEWVIESNFENFILIQTQMHLWIIKLISNTLIYIEVAGKWLSSLKKNIDICPGDWGQWCHAICFVACTIRVEYLEFLLFHVANVWHVVYQYLWLSLDSNMMNAVVQSIEILNG